MAHPFTELRAEYEHDLAILRVTKPEEVDQIARRLMRGDAIPQYAAVQKALGIPIVVQAAICERESGADFSKSPAQGDPWNRVSKNVPRGKGPYPSWYAAAFDSFHNIDHLDDNSAQWEMPYAMWKWEGYNGFGYRSHRIRSPYLVGGTNLQQDGKYDSDGHFNAGMKDTQIGTVPVALRMIELMPALAFGPSIPRIAAPSIIPATLPVPAGVGGGLASRGALTGTEWIQDSLNKLMLPASDRLDVDGRYGRFTRMAIRAFQTSVGLPPDGLIDDATCDLIDRELAKLPH